MESIRRGFRPPHLLENPGFVTLSLDELDRTRQPIDSGRWKARVGAIRLFDKFFGDLRPDQIAETQLVKFVDFLQQTSSNHSKHRPPIVVGHKVHNASNTGHKVLSPKTIAQHLNSLAWLWDAVAGADDVGRVRNPFKSLGLPRSEPPKSKGLSQREVELVFGTPIFTSNDRPVAGLGEACFWLPLLVLWTGADPEEIANLRTSDFNQSEQETEATVTLPGYRRPKRQTADTQSDRVYQAASRAIPLAKSLSDLNLTDYVAWQNSRGEEMLFPEFHLKRTCQEQLDRFTHWWSGYLSHHAIRLSKPKPLRELRKTWLAEAGLRGVSIEAQRYILGQASKSREHSPEVMAALSKEAHKIAFSDWNFANIQGWRAPDPSHRAVNL